MSVATTGNYPLTNAKVIEINVKKKKAFTGVLDYIPGHNSIFFLCTLSGRTNPPSFHNGS